jgi:hypothetical protein
MIRPDDMPSIRVSVMAVWSLEADRTARVPWWRAGSLEAARALEAYTNNRAKCGGRHGITLLIVQRPRCDGLSHSPPAVLYR